MLRREPDDAIVARRLGPGEHELSDSAERVSDKYHRQTGWSTMPHTPQAVIEGLDVLARSPAKPYTMPSGASRTTLPTPRRTAMPPSTSSACSIWCHHRPR